MSHAVHFVGDELLEWNSCASKRQCKFQVSKHCISQCRTWFDTHHWKVCLIQPHGNEDNSGSDGDQSKEWSCELCQFHSWQQSKNLKMQMLCRRVKISATEQFTTISKIDVSIALHCSAMSISLLSVEWSHSHACALLGLGPFGVKQFNVPSDAHVKNMWFIVLLPTITSQSIFDFCFPIVVNSCWFLVCTQWCSQNGQTQSPTAATAAGRSTS